MPLLGKKITEREKAALYYHVFGGVDDWRQLYEIADAATDAKNEIKFLDIYISRWKNSEKVKTFLKVIQKQKADQDAEERNKGREEERTKARESEHTETKPETRQKKEIDYSDPKNRRQLYNEVIANSGDDYKTKLDAAKVFEQIQKDDREAARQQKQQRVYLPAVCNECPLYLKARKRLQNNNFVARETDPGEGKTTII